jgi:branched-chain amino acid transport system substrate-binding protein
LALAIDKAGADAQDVKDELYDVKDYKGAGGVLTFDRNGDVAGQPFSLLVVENGEFVEVK